MEEDLSKLVLTEPVKFQGKYYEDALIKKMENQIYTNFLTILIVNDEKAIYYLDERGAQCQDLRAYSVDS